MQLISLTGKYLFDPDNVTKKHEKQSEWKTTAFVNFDNCEMHMYYAWFLKKRFNLILNKPVRSTHISFINDKLTKEQYENYFKIKEEWNGKDVNIIYSPELVRTNGNHWWLKAECKHADELRTLIGLDKIFFPYHITIGYVNEKNVEHSEYILRQITKFDL